MLEQLDGMPEGTLGYRAVGVVEPDDYKNVLDPAIEAVLAGNEKINLLYEIGDDFDRYSLGAMWQDAKLAATPRRSWGRIAFVTDHDWMGHAISLLSFLAPGEIKAFPLSEIEAAKTWLAE